MGKESEEESVVKSDFEFKKLPLDNKGNLITYIPMLKSPTNMVIISHQKTGKTQSMMGEKNFLIGDCEGGTKYFKGSNKVNLLTFDNSNGELPYTKLSNGMIVPTGLWQVIQEMRKANNMKEYFACRRAFEDVPSVENHEKLLKCIHAMKLPIFVVDTITHFMNIVEDCALYEYNLNLSSTTPPKSNIKRVDTYSGTSYIRKTLLELKTLIETAAPFVIYNAHTKLRKAVMSKTQDEISVPDIDLEGQLPGIFTSKADAVGILYRNKEGVFLDFSKIEESPIDARPEHLGGRVIKISELHQMDDSGKIKIKGKTYWSEVFPELTF